MYPGAKFPQFGFRSRRSGDDRHDYGHGPQLASTIRISFAPTSASPVTSARQGGWHGAALQSAADGLHWPRNPPQSSSVAVTHPPLVQHAAVIGHNAPKVLPPSMLIAPRIWSGRLPQTVVLAKVGILEAVGYVRTRRPKTHARPITGWRIRTGCIRH